MTIKAVMLSVICVAVLLGVSACTENKPDESESAVQYYLYEEAPGPLFWEAEKQADLGNPEKARELFLKSCEEGTGGSCAVMGTMFQNGEGGEADDEQACRYYRKSCDMGFAQACNVVAAILEGDLCGAPDLVRSKALYAIACDAGVIEACVDLGEFHEHGLGGDVDLETARDLYLAACSEQNQDGCVPYARLMLSGMGDEAEIVAALKILKQGCGDNDPKSCYLLAKAIPPVGELANKVTEYYFKARAGFQSECQKSDETDEWDACFDFHYMVARGRGGPVDVKLARDFFEQACAEGHQPSCKELSEPQYSNQ